MYCYDMKTYKIFFLGMCCSVGKKAQRNKEELHREALGNYFIHLFWKPHAGRTPSKWEIPLCATGRWKGKNKWVQKF